MENSEIKIFRERLDINEIQDIAQATFGDMAKAVVDIDQKIIAIGGELHADAESILLEDGSKQASLWGINLYPGKAADNFIEYTSLINIRPSVNNRSQQIQDPVIRNQIKVIIDEMLKKDEI